MIEPGRNEGRDGMTMASIDGRVVMMSSLLVMAAGLGASGMAPGAAGWRVAVTLAVAALITGLVAAAHVARTSTIPCHGLRGGHTFEDGTRRFMQPSAGDDAEDVVVLDEDGGHPVIIVGGRPWHGRMVTARSTAVHPTESVVRETLATRPSSAWPDHRSAVRS